jgi:hypothetical protein
MVVFVQSSLEFPSDVLPHLFGEGLQCYEHLVGTLTAKASEESEGLASV